MKAETAFAVAGRQFTPDCAPPDPAAPAACDFCHLPLPSFAIGRAAPGGPHEPRYCCYGCRFAADVTKARGDAGQATWMLTRLGVAVFLTMAVMMLSPYLYGLELSGPAAEASSAATAQRIAGVMRYLCFLFATPVFIILGLPILSNAWGQLRRRVVSTDALLALGVTAAFVFSYAATLAGSGAIYYETGCVILVLVTLGRWLEATGRLRASHAITGLAALLPSRVRVQRGGGDAAAEIPVEQVRPGDVVLAAAGDRLAVDGVIESGRALVDEQIVTGESRPLERGVGDRVRAGSISLDGSLAIRATAVGADSTVGRLAALLESAKRTRSAHERLADRVASAFVPAIVALALLAAVLGWRRGGAGEALLSSLAVMLIACPCALGIATPMAVWTALGRAASRQVLFRGGEQLERLAGVRWFCFDKTGTLTTGTPELAAVEIAGHDAAIAVMRLPGEFAQRLTGTPACDAAQALLAQAAGLSIGSNHVLSRAIVAAAHRGGIEPVHVDEVRTVPGRGLIGRTNAGDVLLGNRAMMGEAGLSFDAALDGDSDGTGARAADGGPRAWIGWNGAVRGAFTFTESLRSDAGAALRDLRSLDCGCTVLTGDHAARGRALASELGVETLAELRPDDKLQALHRLRAAHGAIAMVGDGLNDAPALAAADVGVALGCGADLTRESAGVCLLGDDLSAVPWAVRLARRTVRTIRVNLFWAFVYNLAGVGLALTGRLSPLFAAAAMVVSSLFVVGNSLRLTRFEK